MIIGCFNSLFGSDERKKTTKGPMYLEIKGPKSANLASLETMLHQEQMFRKHRVYITSSNSDQVEVVEIRNNERITLYRGSSKTPEQIMEEIKA